MGALHRAYAVTGAICTAGASMIEGTIVHEVLGKERRERNLIRLGHPGGRLDVEVEMEKEGGAYRFKRATVCRTARRLMEGQVLVPERVF
jgi:2-methylaconitate cis-trans-isomerase PrpF